ncbi:MAG: hypothetical protein FJ318_09340 [SAR202 cluster bacterium]|nr:hypothetical protein [SAR202 cluster bacterium]
MFEACSTTGIVCRPNCPPGRRMKPEHRVSFPSLQAAREAGYRPCRVCLPDVGEPGPWAPRSRRAAR